MAAKLDAKPVLRPGIRAGIEIQGEKLKNVIAIPRSAIQHESGRAYCKVRGKQGVEKREIAIGLGDRERVHIIRGLQNGDVLIVKEAATPKEGKSK